MFGITSLGAVTRHSAPCCSCHPDEGEAVRRGLDGFRFFGYSLVYYAVFGEHRPECADLWQRFLQVKDLAGKCRARRHRHARAIARAFEPL
jgi:hypothetical protein